MEEEGLEVARIGFYERQGCKQCDGVRFQCDIKECSHNGKGCECDELNEHREETMELNPTNIGRQRKCKCIEAGCELSKCNT